MENVWDLLFQLMEHGDLQFTCCVYIVIQYSSGLSGFVCFLMRSSGPQLSVKQQPDSLHSFQACRSIQPPLIYRLHPWTTIQVGHTLFAPTAVRDVSLKMYETKHFKRGSMSCLFSAVTVLK
jgi:hypothetical protein